MFIKETPFKQTNYLKKAKISLYIITAAVLGSCISIYRKT